MDNLQKEAIRRMFYARRAQPSDPDHALVIESELASLKVLEKKDHDNYKKFYDDVKKKLDAEAKAEPKEVNESVVVSNEELMKIAAAKNANSLPLPEGTDGEVEEKKREAILAARGDIAPVKIDTPLGEDAIVDPVVDDEDVKPMEEVNSVDGGKLSESAFKELGSSEQKDLLEGVEGDKSNAEKRYALYQ